MFCFIEKKGLHKSVSQHHFIVLFFFAYTLFCNNTHTAVWHLKTIFHCTKIISFPYLIWKTLFNHSCYYALLTTTIKLLLSRDAQNLFLVPSFLMNERTKRSVPLKLSAKYLSITKSHLMTFLVCISELMPTPLFTFCLICIRVCSPC